VWDGLNQEGLKHETPYRCDPDGVSILLTKVFRCLARAAGPQELRLATVNEAWNVRTVDSTVGHLAREFRSTMTTNFH
jgi:hypothetical protein